MKKADLHVHSCFSDGTNTIAEIIELAIKKNIILLAITDHNKLDGSKELISLCNKKEIRVISGVELDAMYDGVNYHILAYGIDLDSVEFNNFVEKNQNLLEKVNKLLVVKMAHDYENISLADYLDFTYDKRKGGWKALHYFISKGIATDPASAWQKYVDYSHDYTCVDFPSIDEICRQIHNAGGKAVLAHPGKMIKFDSHSEFKNKLLKLIDLGLDGIEVYYPHHSEEIEKACLEICEEKNLLITSGSDFHGKFGNINIGGNECEMTKLNLGDLFR